MVAFCFEIDALTKDLSRQQQILEEITKELVIFEEDLTGFGLHLGFTHEMIQQTRTNHPGSVEGAALHLTCLWWSDGMATREEKVPTFLEAVRAIGRIRQVGWVEEKLKRGIEGSTVDVVGGIDQVEGDSVNVVGGIDQEEGTSVNVVGGTDQEEGTSVNVVGGRDQIEGPSVMVVDQVEEMRDAIVPVRERFVGGATPTDA